MDNLLPMYRLSIDLVGFIQQSCLAHSNCSLVAFTGSCGHVLTWKGKCN